MHYSAEFMGLKPNIIIIFNTTNTEMQTRLHYFSWSILDSLVDSNISTFQGNVLLMCDGILVLSQQQGFFLLYFNVLKFEVF